MPKLDVGRIPCTILTGFLGSGKTTILRHVLQTSFQKRLAVIVNEFGDVGLDGDILKGCANDTCPETDIVELANGCLCCTVADDFIPALDKILSRDPKVDHILIETSGLALPKPLVQAFQWPSVRSRVTVDAVVAVVDGLALKDGQVAADLKTLDDQRRKDSHLDHDTPIDEVFLDQIACADLVLLTKGDLLDPAGYQRALDRVRPHVPPAVKVVSVARGRVDPGVLMGLGLGVEDLIDQRQTLHDGMGDHDHDDFDSLVIDIPPIAQTQDLMERIARLSTDLGALRVKGYVEVVGKPLRLLVQAVGARVTSHFEHPWPDAQNRKGRLVIIGEKGMDGDKVTALLLAPPSLPGS